MTNESQLRWVGPEKGVIHMATAAIVNAFWDLWAKMEHKPVWKLLVDMTPEELVSLIDFKLNKVLILFVEWNSIIFFSNRYIDDCITKSEAIDILKANAHLKHERELEILETGYPAYTTQVCTIIIIPDQKVDRMERDYEIL